MGFSDYRRILRNLICIPPKKVSGSKHVVSEPDKLLFLLRNG